jgi:acyl-ACP thioesterase
MRKYYFHYRTKNGTMPPKHLNSSFYCQDLEDAVAKAESINRTITDAFVMHVEDIDSGEFAYI